jgi:CUB/sushi domain-containing protein
LLSNATIVRPPVLCPTLSIENGRVVSFSDDSRVGSRATFACNTGYVLSSTDAAVCTLQAGGVSAAWFPVPTCNAPQPTITTCGLLVVLNGVVSYSNGQNVNSQATVTCNAGYRLSSTTPACCSAHGTWTNVPTCNLCPLPPAPVQTPVLCPALSIENGRVVSFSDDSRVGSRATFSCNTGYVLSSNDAAVCLLQAGGVSAAWFPVPTCNAPQPTVVTCGLLAVPHGYVVSYSNQQLVNSQAVVACKIGYRLSSTTPACCSAQGTWTNVPICQSY